MCSWTVRAEEQRTRGEKSSVGAVGGGVRPDIIHINIRVIVCQEQFGQIWAVCRGERKRRHRGSRRAGKGGEKVRTGLGAKRKERRARYIVPLQEKKIRIGAGRGERRLRWEKGMAEEKEFHRRSIRIRGADYTQPGGYLVTICTSGLQVRTLKPIARRSEGAFLGRSRTA